MSRARTRDRRHPGRRVDPVTLLAFLIPVLTIAVLATVSPSPTEEGPREPSAAPLGATLRVCPPALAGAGQVLAASSDPATAGTLQVTGGKDLVVRPGQLAARGVAGALVVRARDGLAPGLVAARGGAGAGTDCRAPESDVWFAGVGAGPEHGSVLTLTNPDGGPALADVTVLTADGLREVSRLRGVAVEPRGELSVDLAELVPERDEVSVRVTVSRGRLASWTVDRVAPLGGDDRAEAYLPPAAAPATDQLVPGVGRGPGERILVLANAGDAQAQVEIQAVTPESEFAPNDLAPVQVPPGSSVAVDLSGFLGSPAASDVLGLRLRSAQPVTGVVRTRVGSRMTHAVATTPLQERGALVLDAGAKRLVLAGVEETDEVQVLQRAADGRALPERRVQVLPGRGARVPLSPEARYVEVVVGQQPVSAAVEGGEGFPWVRPVTELLVETRVPHVGPALY